MNLTDIIYSAENIVKESYDRPTWKTMIGSVLAELTDVAKLNNTKFFERNMENYGTQIDIDADFPELYELIGVQYRPIGQRRKSLKQIPYYDTASTGWHKDRSFIYIQNLPQNYTTCGIFIHFYEKLAMLQDGEDETFNLPEEHHDVILKGLLYKVAQREEDHNRLRTFSNDYMLAKQQMLAKRISDLETWNAPFVLANRLGVSK